MAFEIMDWVDPVDLLGTQSRRKALESSKGAAKLYDQLELPEIEKLIQEGQLTPEMLQQSELSSYQDDPMLRDAQLDALNSLQGTVDAGGLDAQAQARLSQVQGDIASQDRGQREAILANQRARGLGGSGVELAAQLANQQGSAQRQNTAGLETASIAEQRKSDALRDLANLGGSIRGQDFGQAEAKASARDRINQFNTGARNQAQQINLSERQRISDTNKQAPQQNYQNQLSKTSGQANAMVGVGNQLNQQAQNNQQLTGTALTALGTYYGKASDERVKENVQPFDPSAFLDELTGYKYQYKNPEKHGQGEQVGVMAQDLEKGAPQAVSEDPEGVKRIDYDKLGGPILAALAEMNKKINALGGK